MNDPDVPMSKTGSDKFEYRRIAFSLDNPHQDFTERKKSPSFVRIA